MASLQQTKSHWLIEAIDLAVRAAFDVSRKHARQVVFQILVTVTNHAITFLGSARTIGIVRDIVETTPRYPFLAQLPTWCKGVVRGDLPCRTGKDVADEDDMGQLGRIVDAEVYAMLRRIEDQAFRVVKYDSDENLQILAEELTHLRRYREALNGRCPW